MKNCYFFVSVLIVFEVKSEPLCKVFSRYKHDDTLTCWNIPPSLKFGISRNISSLELLFIEESRVSVLLENSTISKFPNLKVLTLKNLGLRNIKPLALIGLWKLEELDLSKNYLQELQRSWFSVNLKRINLSENQIKDINCDSFPQLPRLEEINLSNNRITTLRSGLFLGFTSLRNIDLFKNLIKVIETEVFAKSSQNIDLSGNMISDIHPEYFPGLTELLSINIDHNNLRTLRNNSFPNCTSMETFTSSHNEIENVEAEAFKGVKRLYKLDFSYNKLSDKFFHNVIISFSDYGSAELEDCYFKEDELNLSGNQLNILHDDSFRDCPNIQNFNASHNQIEFLEPKTFKGAFKLLIVDLSYNIIEYINPNQFSDLSELSSLHLEHNEISELPDNLLTPCKSLYEFDVSYNNIEHISSGLFHNFSSTYIVSLHFTNNNLKMLDGNMFSMLNGNTSQTLSIDVVGNNFNSSQLSEFSSYFSSNCVSFYGLQLKVYIDQSFCRLESDNVYLNISHRDCIVQLICGNINV